MMTDRQTIKGAITLLKKVRAWFTEDRLPLNWKDVWEDEGGKRVETPTRACKACILGGLEAMLRRRPQNCVERVAYSTVLWVSFGPCEKHSLKEVRAIYGRAIRCLRKELAGA